MKRKNRIIYSNQLSIDDWKEKLEEYKDYLRDEGLFSEASIEKIDIFDNVFTDWVYNELEWYYEDLLATCDVEISKDIIVLADLGLWYGRREGIRVLGSNVKACFLAEKDCEYVSWELDRHNLISVQHHHDGTHYLTYRRMKDNKHTDLLVEKMRRGELTKRDISKYTVTLKHTIERIW